MERKIIYIATILIAMLGIDTHAQTGYVDFSAESPSGHILFYKGASWGVATVVPQNVINYGYEPAYTNLSGNVVIPDTVEYGGVVYRVTEIGAYAFQGCGQLTGVSIPNSIEHFDLFSFRNCTGLTSVTIPCSANIGAGVFAGCSNLTTVTIEGVSLSYMYNDPCGHDYMEPPFHDCDNLKTVVIGRNVEYLPAGLFEENYGIRQVYFNADSCRLNDNGGPTSPFDYSNYNLKKIVFGDSVRYFPEGLLATECDTIVLGASMRTIEQTFYVFPQYCSVVKYNGSIDNWCKINFGWNSNPVRVAHNLYINDILVTNLAIPSSVTKINDHAFEGLQSLISVTIPSSVTEIGQRAFYDCTNLTSLSLPESITTIPIESFAATGITSVTIPNTITKIDHRAFKDCVNLSSFTFPYTVDTIGTDVFEGCIGLTSLTFERQNPPVLTYNRPFAGVPTNIPVHVPCGRTSEYRDYFYSKEVVFHNFVEPDSCYGVISLVPNDSTMGFTLGSGLYGKGTDVTIVAVPAVGFEFKWWSDGVDSNPRTLIVLSDSTLTAFFDSIPIHFDTMVVHDTAIVRDTVNAPIIIYDTTIVPVSLNDTTIVPITINDTTIVPVVINDTTVISIIVNDTTIIPISISDTTIIPVSINDTTIVPVIIHDTTYVNDTTFISIEINDTTIIPISINDTTIVPVAINDTTIIYVTIRDTAFVEVVINDTAIVTININDTTIIPVLISDTTIIPVTQYDTTFIDIIVFDSTLVPIHDTTYVDVIHEVHDTTVVTMTDTLVIETNITDTLIVTDTLVVDNYITDTLTVTDTLVVIDYLTDTLYLWDTLYLTDTVYIHDTVYVHDSVGVDDVATVNYTVYATGSQVVVEGDFDGQVALYDVNGRVLAVKRNDMGTIRFDVASSGAYLIKVGNHPARKIVVVR